MKNEGSPKKRLNLARFNTVQQYFSVAACFKSCDKNELTE